MGLKVCVVGHGHWGRNLARNFNDLGVLYAVCELNIEKHALIQKQLNPQCIYSTYEELLLDSNIDAVVIATPTATHYELAKAALDANKHVFVEKAMCNSSIEAANLVDIARKNNKQLMVGHLLHYHPAIQKVKDLMSSSLIGHPLYFQFDRLNFGSVGPEKSALWAFGPHDFSLLAYFCKGYQLDFLKSYQVNCYDRAYSDLTHVFFSFHNNLKVSVNSSWMSPIPKRQFILTGTKGSLVFDDLQNLENKLKWYPADVSFDKGLIFSKQDCESIAISSCEPLKNECKEFVDVCLLERASITSGIEGLHVMSILEAVSYSAKENIEVRDQQLFIDRTMIKKEEIECVY